MTTETHTPPAFPTTPATQQAARAELRTGKGYFLSNMGGGAAAGEEGAQEEQVRLPPGSLLARLQQLVYLLQLGDLLVYYSPATGLKQLQRFGGSPMALTLPAAAFAATPATEPADTLTSKPTALTAGANSATGAEVGGTKAVSGNGGGRSGRVDGWGRLDGTSVGHLSDLLHGSP